MANEPSCLLDVNVLLALTAKGHVHHKLVKSWFYAAPDRAWSLCAFTEAGFVRLTTALYFGETGVVEATAILQELARHPGYRYLPIDADWLTLCGPLFHRLYGSKQVTDAYLLGLALREGLVLVTLDRGIVHLAGEEHSGHVLLLGSGRETRIASGNDKQNQG